jgi:hypothetical protein
MGGEREGEIERNRERGRERGIGIYEYVDRGIERH